MQNKMDFHNQIVSVEKLHELASDQMIEHIYLSKDAVFGKDIGCQDCEREFSKWELRFKGGPDIWVYV